MAPSIAWSVSKHVQAPRASGHKYELVVKCKLCKGEHPLILDASGSFSGTMPCDRTYSLDLQVDPQFWRQVMEEEAARTVH